MVITSSEEDGGGEAKSARNGHRVIEVRAVDKLNEDNIEFE